MSGTYVTLLDIYSNDFTSNWQQVIATASYPFRTVDSVKPVSDTLDALCGYAKQADDLIADIVAGRVSSDKADAQIASVSLFISAKEKASGTLIAGVERLDQNNLKKAATLDQPRLRTLANDLKDGADATLSTNLKKFETIVTEGLIAAKAASGSSSSDTDKTIAAMDTTVKKFDLSSEKPSASDIVSNNKLSGAPMPYWQSNASV